MHPLPVAPDRYAAFLLSTLPRLAAVPALRGGRRVALDAALDRGFAEGRAGIGVELGVWKGRSLRHAARRHPHRRFVGFDSLRGFPDDGRPDWRMDFSVARPPRLPANCRFIEGFFDHTLPAFAAASGQPVAVLNIDCDIQTSTHAGLSALGPYLAPGSALHLDEVLNYDTWLWNEMLALFRFLEATGMGVEWLAHRGRVRDLPATLAHLDAGRYPAWADDVAAGFHRQAACVLTAANTDLAILDDPARQSEIAALAERLSEHTRAYAEGRLQLQNCHPDDLRAPPPPRPAWRRWLGLA